MKQYEFKNSYTCFFVFVGGKYVQEIATVVDRVEDISKQFHGIKPVAIIVIGKFGTWETNNLSSYGQNLTKVGLVDWTTTLLHALAIIQVQYIKMN